MAKTGSNLKLLGAWTSPYGIRPQIAFNIKSVTYEFIHEERGNKSELLLKSNPIHKKIPVLIHNNKPICESLIIVQYIDEVWSSGPSILPSDPYDRAIARFWGAYIDDKWYPSLFGIVRAQGAAAKAAAYEQAIQNFITLEEAFKTCSKGKGFFGGDRIGYVDIALGCFLGWVRVFEKISAVKLLDEEKIPCLVSWSERFCADDAVKDLMPETAKLLEYAKRIFGFR